MAGSGWHETDAGRGPAGTATEDAIRTGQRLSDDQKAALIAVYRTMLGQRQPGSAGPGSL
jgi:hypothetical protein